MNSSRNLSVLLNVFIFLMQQICLIFAQEYSSMIRLVDVEDFKLDYDVIRRDTVEFRIEANVTGWVAVGFNYNQLDTQFDNTDYAIGYVNQKQNVIRDYYIFPGVKQNIPQPDPEIAQNWFIRSASETFDNSTEKNTTTIHFSRELKSSDPNYDLDIRDSTLHLIWAYHNTSDNPNEPSSMKGVIKINLLSGKLDGKIGDGEGPPEYAMSPRSISGASKIFSTFQFIFALSFAFKIIYAI